MEKLKGILTQERLKEVLTYDPDTGFFTRVDHRTKKIVRAGTVDPKGYRRISIDKAIYLEDRLAVFYVTGKAVKKLIHTNGNVADSSYGNLKEIKVLNFFPEKGEITRDMIEQAYTYDPKTGAFTRNFSEGGEKAGAQAGCVNTQGYISLGYRKKHLLAHRVAYLFMEGKWPEKEVDHIDGDRKNNKWANLREATGSENGFNTRLRKDNKTGVKGIRIYNNGTQYVSYIRAHHKTHYIGCYRDLKAAEKATREARQELHREFCNHG